MAGESVAFFERRYMPLREAKISIVDPAITKSDIVFDVVSTTDRVFFRLDDHVHRFEISCRKIRVTLPVGGDEIKRISAECVHRSGFDDACVFMCGTRGLYRSGGVLGDPRAATAEGGRAVLEDVVTALVALLDGEEVQDNDVGAAGEETEEIA